MLAVKFRAEPAHIGLLFPAVGAVGIGFTVAVVVAAPDVQPFDVTVTEYVPDAAVVAAAIEGFWLLEVKLFGPVQL